MSGRDPGTSLRPPLDAVPSVCDCDPAQEVRRSADLLSRLSAIEPAVLVRPDRPVPGPDLVSVVVPAYNAESWISACLSSLLIQTHTNIEVFVVDDASEDSTWERVVREFGHEGRLCAVRLARNVGPYQIKNWVAAELARGALLAMQDADDFSHPSRLRTQRDWMDRHGHVIAGTCVHQFFEPGIEPRYEHAPAVRIGSHLHDLVFYASVPRASDPVSILDVLDARGALRFDNGNGRSREVPGNRSVTYYGSFMVRRETYLAFGGMDGHTRIQADQDFAWRLLRFHDVGTVPSVLYSRRLHPRSLTRDPATRADSPLRKAYCRTQDGRHERIRCALGQGDWERVRELCTSDLHYADVEVSDVRSGFSNALTDGRRRHPWN